MLLLLRGESFRRGGGRSAAARSAREPQEDMALQRQVKAWRTVQTNVVRPAGKVGWGSILFADVLCPAPYKQRLRSALKKELGVPANRVRAREPAALLRTQVVSVVNSLIWCMAEVERMRGSWPRQWGSLMMVRADIEIKIRLAVPPPTNVGSAIIVPFHCSDVPFTNDLGRPTVADAIHFLPRSRVAELLARLQSHLGYGSMHSLCEWVHNVHYFVPSRHNANSQIEWNPIYRFVGRDEGEPSAAHIIGMMRRSPDSIGRPCS